MTTDEMIMLGLLLAAVEAQQKHIESLDRRLTALEQNKAQMDNINGLTPANVKNCG